MSFQDDPREKDAIVLFELKEGGQGRSGRDAYLEFEGREIDFELKSTSNGDVTTVRDFGLDHIIKWKQKHWIIGFYENKEVIYYHYATPQKIAPWIQEKEDYIKHDFKLAQCVPPQIQKEVLYEILGEKDFYTLEDAQKIHKKQYTKKQYLDLMDQENAYSPEKMLEMIQDRSRYLIERGSTLNNPHIPASYFKGWEKILPDAQAKVRLRELVKIYFNASATDDAT